MPPADAPPPTIVVEPTPEPPPPPRADADDRARAVVAANLWALIDVKRMRQHESGVQLMRVLFTMRALYAAGFDPIWEAERAFIAARRAEHSPHQIMVFEHDEAPSRIAAAMGRVMKREEGSERLDEQLGVPAVLVRFKHSPPVVMMAPTHNMLLITSQEHAEAASRLRHSAGLPNLPAGVAIEAVTKSPAASLQGRRVPPLPEAMVEGRGAVAFNSDGGCEVTFGGDAADPDSAREVAAQLNALIEDIGEVGFGPLKVNLLRGFEITPSGSSFGGKRSLSASETELFVDLMLAFAARPRKAGIPWRERKR